jgi:hypothetical protein
MSIAVCCQRFFALFLLVAAATIAVADEPNEAIKKEYKKPTAEETVLRKLEHQLRNKFKLERDLETIAKLPMVDEPTKKYQESVETLLAHVNELIARLDPDGSLRLKLPPPREFKRLFEDHQRLLEDQRFYASQAGLNRKGLAEKVERLTKAIAESEQALLKQDPTGRWQKILEAEIKPGVDRRKRPVPQAE